MSDSDHPKFTPLLAPPNIEEINKNNRKFWENANRLVEKRLADAPSAGQAAINQINDMMQDGVPAKWVPSFELLVLKGSNSLEQSRRGGAKRKIVKGNRVDAIDELALEIWRHKTYRDLPAAFEDVWSEMVSRILAGKADLNFEVCENGNRIILYPAPPPDDPTSKNAKKPKPGRIRSMSKTSFKFKFSELKRAG